MKKTILSLCMLFLCLTNVSLAQELNFSVTVNSKQVAGTDQRVYEALQEGMVNFLNNRIWTNVKFEDYERLEGAMVVQSSGNTSVLFTTSFATSLSRVMLTVAAVPMPTLTSFSAPNVSEVFVDVSITGCVSVTGSAFALFPPAVYS